MTQCFIEIVMVDAGLMCCYSHQSLSSFSHYVPMLGRQRPKRSYSGNSVSSDSCDITSLPLFVESRF